MMKNFTAKYSPFITDFFQYLERNLLIRKTLSLIALLLISGCDFLPKPLTDKDIEKYIAAYNNIAEASPILEKQKEESRATSVFTCKECYTTLHTPVTQAGYADLQEFLIADARIHLTLKYYAYAEITKLAGEVGGEVSGNLPVEEFCSSPENLANTEDPKEAKKQCENFFAWTGYLKTISNAIYSIAEKLLTDGDIAVVTNHIEGLEKALFNPKLVSDFRHIRGGVSFDD
jgi:hypothetical protein